MREAFRNTLLYQWIFQPRGPEESVTLVQRRVYIVPSRPGLLFGATLLTMLFSSINYDLSLGFVLTFLLAGLGLVAMLFTFRNQAQLTLGAGRAEPVFAGEKAQFEVTLHNNLAHERGAVWVKAAQVAADVQTVVDVPAAPKGGSSQVTAWLSLPTTRRGWMSTGRLTIETRYPLGLFRAWSYWVPSQRVLVYPRPAPDARQFPVSPDGGGEGAPSGQGHDDFSSLREAHAADSPRHIAWKAAASQIENGGPLLAKQFMGQAAQEVWLDFQATPAEVDIEARISVLTRWVLDAESQGLRYGLRLPSRGEVAEIAPDRGEGHRTRCLTALALMGA
jgi:uncharacterized protein (DUF58 family)